MIKNNTDSIEFRSCFNNYGSFFSYQSVGDVKISGSGESSGLFDVRGPLHLSSQAGVAYTLLPQNRIVQRGGTLFFDGSSSGYVYQQSVLQVLNGSQARVLSGNLMFQKAGSMILDTGIRLSVEGGVVQFNPFSVADTNGTASFVVTAVSQSGSSSLFYVTQSSSVIVSNDYLFSGGTLSIAGQLEIMGAVQWTGGTLQGVGTLLVHGPFTFNGGAMTGSGTARLFGVSSFGQATGTLLAWNVEVWNTTTWTTGNITTNGYGGVTVRDGGTFITANNFNIYAPLVISGAGTVRKNGTGLVSFRGSVSAAGTMNLVAGTAEFAGTISFTSGSTLDLTYGALNIVSPSATIGLGALITGNGTIDVKNGGVLTIAATSCTTSQIIVEAGGTLQLAAGARIASASVCTPTLPGFAVTVASGTFNVLSMASGEFVNLGSLTMTGSASGSINGRLIVSTKTEMNAATGQLKVSTSGALDNSGQLLLRSGEITGAGPVTVATTGSFSWLSGTLSGGGSFQVDGSTSITCEVGTCGPKTLDTKSLVFSSSSIVTWKGSNITTLNGPTIEAGGVMSLSDGVRLLNGGGGSQQPYFKVAASGSVEVVNGTMNLEASLNAQGSIQVTTGQFNMVNGGSALGNLRALSGAAFNFGGGSFVFDVAARLGGAGNLVFSGGAASVKSTLNVTGGAIQFAGCDVSFLPGLSVINPNIPLDVSGGTVTYSGTSFNVPSVTLSGGGALATESSLTVSTTFTMSGQSALKLGSGGDLYVNGTFFMGGGTLVGDGNMFVRGLFMWTSGVITGFGYMDVTSGGRWIANDTSTKHISTRTVRVYSDALWSGGNIIADGSGGLTTASGGTFNIAGSGTFDTQDFVTGQAQFVVQPGGTVRRTGPGITYVNARRRTRARSALRAAASTSTALELSPPTSPWRLAPACSTSAGPTLSATARSTRAPEPSSCSPTCSLPSSAAVSCSTAATSRSRAEASSTLPRAQVRRAPLRSTFRVASSSSEPSLRRPSCTCSRPSIWTRRAAQCRSRLRPQSTPQAPSRLAPARLSACLACWR